MPYTRTRTAYQGSARNFPKHYRANGVGTCIECNGEGKAHHDLAPTPRPFATLILVLKQLQQPQLLGGAFLVSISQRQHLTLKRSTFFFLQRTMLDPVDAAALKVSTVPPAYLSQQSLEIYALPLGVPGLNTQQR
eukprot:690907-Rhodomonas_salina.1